MLKFKPYYFYSKSDIDKEPIDKIIALDFNNALEYFCERKQLDQYTFLKLYEIIEENGN